MHTHIHEDMLPLMCVAQSTGEIDFTDRRVRFAH